MKFLLLAAVLTAVTVGDHIVPATIIGVYDGDTITVRAQVWPNSYWEGKVRLRGVDTPELGGRAKCPEEAEAALRARTLVQRYIGQRVLVINPANGKYAGRIIADVITEDGKFLDEVLMEAGLAREYGGGKRGTWCPTRAG